jgi:hypothetical protein
MRETSCNNSNIIKMGYVIWNGGFRGLQVICEDLELALAFHHDCVVFYANLYSDVVLIRGLLINSCYNNKLRKMARLQTLQFAMLLNWAQYYSHVNTLIRMTCGY